MSLCVSDRRSAPPLPTQIIRDRGLGAGELTVTIMFDPVQPGQSGRAPADLGRNPAIDVSNSSAAEAVIEAVLRGERFIALTGEPGVTRSAIVDAVAIDLVEAGSHVVRVWNSAPGPLRVSRLVVLILGGQHTQGVEDELQRLVHALADQAYEGQRLVLVIEDADKLEGPALEMLRLLPGVRRKASPGAQILLAGRPGFWTLLAADSQPLLGKISAIRNRTKARR